MVNCSTLKWLLVEVDIYMSCLRAFDVEPLVHEARAVLDEVIWYLRSHSNQGSLLDSKLAA